MATITNDVDWKSAPEDYAALHQIYYPFMVNLVAKFGIDEDNKEDVASEIFLRFMERGFLEQFDPSLVFEYEGELRPARFKSFLARAVSLYVRGYYDKQKRIKRREIQICDMHMGNEQGHGFADAPGESWADLYGEENRDHADDVIELVMEEQDATGTRQFLATCERRSLHDTCDLVEVFDAVRAQLLEFGEYDVRLLRQKFGISTTTMHNWLWWLKKNLAVAYGIPCPPKRRRTIKDKTT